MNRILPRVAMWLAIALALPGCGVQLGRIRLSGADAKTSQKVSQKDCAACEKMCAVAGNAEDDKASVASCVEDCRKRCS